jgi:hypothetical protein
MVTYPPIKFECQVEGKNLVAEVVAEETYPGHFNFNTKFSDGFEDTFKLHEPSGSWKAERDKKAAYLKKIKDDLSALVSYQIDRHYLSFRHKIGDRLVNIWVFETEEEDDTRIYTIYYLGDYRFEMKKVWGAWEAKTVRQVNPETIDEKLVAKIGEMVDECIRV